MAPKRWLLRESCSPQGLHSIDPRNSLAIKGIAGVVAAQPGIVFGFGK
jgi:hypothetical protein